MKKYRTKDMKPKTMICQMDWDTKSIQKNADGQITIEGFANTADKDRVGDVVLPSAFSKTMDEYMDNPVLLYQHDWDKVIGHVVEFKIVDDENETKQGLWVKAVISSAKDVDDVRTKIREGSLKTFSIGYNELDADYDNDTDTNIVKELELLEISVVTIPANPFSKFEAGTDEEKGSVDSDLIKFLAEAVSELKNATDATPEFLMEVVNIYNEQQNIAS
jgi:hypothetical protein